MQGPSAGLKAVKDAAKAAKAAKEKEASMPAPPVLLQEASVSTREASPEAEVAPGLFRALYTVFGGGSDKEASTRIATLGAELKPAFEAQTKVVHPWKGADSVVRVSKDSARAVAYAYFEREHGWLVKGLEPPFVVHSSNPDIHEIAVLRKTPDVVQALVDVEKRGFSLGDLAATVAAIERSLLDESSSLVQAAYELNGEDEMDWISKDAVHQILQSYLLMFRQGSKASLTDAAKHKQLKARAAGAGRSWTELTAFESKVVEDFAAVAKTLSEESDSARSYSFEDVGHMARVMTLRYGKWQDAECKAMSHDLLGLDASHDGRVPLETFHAQETNPIYGYKFTESANYLRAFGSLEEQAGQQPQVLIANYLYGPSNCIGTSQFLSVCCLNTCEAVAEEVYQRAHSSAVEPELLGSIVSNLSTPLHAGHRDNLLKELQKIANRHLQPDRHGKVELSKPAFRQWLHHAFPGRCPALAPEMLLPETEAPVLVPLSFDGIASVPPTHRPTAEDCTRMPDYMVTV